jgi:hypothetical protein
MFNGQWYPLVPGSSNLVELPVKVQQFPPMPGSSATTVLKGGSATMEAVISTVKHTNPPPMASFLLPITQFYPTNYTYILMLGQVSGQYYTNYVLPTNAYNPTNGGFVFTLVGSYTNWYTTPLILTVRCQDSFGNYSDSNPFWFHVQSNQLYRADGKTYLSLVVLPGYTVVVRSNGTSMVITNGPIVFTTNMPSLSTNPVAYTTSWVTNNNVLVNGSSVYEITAVTPQPTNTIVRIPITTPGTNGFYRVLRM